MLFLTSWDPFWFGFETQAYLTYPCWVNICSSKINLLNTSFRVQSWSVF